MGFADVDRKASTPFVPNKFLKKLAEKNGVSIVGVKSEEELRRLIDEAKAKAEPVKNGEIIPPAKNGYDDRGFGAHIIMNVPAPQVNVKASVGPQWFDVVANVQNAILYMVLGAALFAVFGKWVGL